VKVVVTELSGEVQRASARQLAPLVVVWLPPVQFQRTKSNCSTTRRAGMNCSTVAFTVETATRGVAMSTPGVTGRAGRVARGRRAASAAAVRKRRRTALLVRGMSFLRGIEGTASRPSLPRNLARIT
jgi:hypothetical protein